MEGCVRWLSKLTFHTSNVVCYHVTRMLEACTLDPSLQLDYGFINKCYRATLNALKGVARKDDEIVRSAVSYAEEMGLNRWPVVPIGWFVRPMEEAGRQMAVNIKTHLPSNLDIYTHRYFRLRVLQDPRPILDAWGFELMLTLWTNLSVIK